MAIHAGHFYKTLYINSLAKTLKCILQVSIVAIEAVLHCQLSFESRNDSGLACREDIEGITLDHCVGNV